YFFKTSRGRSARAPAHEAMSPLRSLAVSEGCLLHVWKLCSPALAVKECALIACYFNEVTILIPFKTFLVPVNRVTLVYVLYSVLQGFSTRGPWPPGGPRRHCRGSAT